MVKYKQIITFLIVTLFSFSNIYSFSAEVNSGMNIIIGKTHYPGILGELLFNIGNLKGEFVTGLGITQVKGRTIENNHISCTYDDNHYIKLIIGFNSFFQKSIYGGMRLNADFEFDNNKGISLDGVIGNRIIMTNKQLYINISGGIGHGIYYFHQGNRTGGYPKIRLNVGIGFYGKRLQ